MLQRQLHSQDKGVVAAGFELVVFPLAEAYAAEAAFLKQT